MPQKNGSCLLLTGVIAVSNEMKGLQAISLISGIGTPCHHGEEIPVMIVDTIKVGGNLQPATDENVRFGSVTLVAELKLVIKGSGHSPTAPWACAKS